MLVSLRLSSPARVILRYLHLRIDITTWNSRHDALSANLARRRNPWSKRLKLFYNIGSVLCILGALASLSIMLRVFWQLVYGLSSMWLHGLSSSDFPKAPVRRSLRTMADAHDQSLNTPILQPIIPGITVPLSHLPVALAAVFIAQAVHELGHAICAALESVPMLSFGASLFLFLPSTFVNLSSVAVESLVPAGRLRVVSAGSFHNLLCWCLLLALEGSGIVAALWFIPYSNISSMGRVVVTVKPHSSLHGHLPVGSLITSLGDTDLHIPEIAADAWKPFTSESLIQRRERGWCIGTPLFPDALEHCCSNEQATVEPSALSCFISLDPPQMERCLDPVQVMAVNRRCFSADGCLHEESCVRPQNPHQLMRIVFRSSPLPRPEIQAEDEIIVWKGSHSQFIEEVQLGILLPRVEMFPLWLPLTVQSLMQYLKLASVSLYLFNLLPLPWLDGGKLLDIVLAAALHHTMTENVDLEVARGPRPTVERWKRISRVIHIMTTTLLGTTVCLGCFNVARSKVYI